MSDDRIYRTLSVVAAVAWLVGIGYLLYSYAPRGLMTFLTIVFAPAALLVVIWGLTRLSAAIGST